MNGNGTEVAFTVTSPVGSNGETDSLKGPDFPLFFIQGMQITLIGKFIDPIEFLGTQGQGRRVTDQIFLIMGLEKAFCSKRIIISVEEMKHFRKFFFVLVYLLP